MSALFENLKDGATVEFLEWFHGVDGWKVVAVLARQAQIGNSRYLPILLLGSRRLVSPKRSTVARTKTLE